jgi:4-aminobutyrate aminotransferase-like enzyme
VDITAERTPLWLLPRAKQSIAKASHHLWHVSGYEIKSQIHLHSNSQPGVFTIPFPYWHQYSVLPTTSEEELVGKSLHQLDLLLAQQTAPSDTAAILIEPCLGEGGYVPAPDAFLQELRAVCDKHGILLIIDEIQSGFCRTGKNFMIEYSGVTPDILVIAKVGHHDPLCANADGLAFWVSCRE